MSQLEFFGESSLSGEAEEKRQATIVAEEKTKVLKLTRTDFTELLGDLKELIKFNFTQKVLASMELFKELTESEKASLVESLKTETYDAGTKIVTQGDPGVSFYIIKSGG